jgi:hypothetical protein
VIRQLAPVALAVALAFGLAGCVSNAPIPTPAPADVVGTWHHGSDTITFNADGSFAAKNVPFGVIEQAGVGLGKHPAGPNESFTGSWTIGSGGTDAGGAPGVLLEFTKPRKIGLDYGLTLVVSGDVPPQLYVLLGHPDTANKYSFTRERQ